MRVTKQDQIERLQRELERTRNMVAERDTRISKMLKDHQHAHERAHIEALSSLAELAQAVSKAMQNEKGQL